MKLYGGAAIGSGSFGCVFHPSLQTVQQPKSDDLVSKLMLNAQQESHKLTPLNGVLQRLPDDVQQFFLVPSPRVLSVQRFEDEDFVGLGEKCNAFFKRHEIDVDALKRNDPEALGQFRVINSQYGGDAVGDIIEATKSAHKRTTQVDALVYTQLLDKYIAFLGSGVGALVAKNVVHGDIKVQNMVWNQAKQLRLIDWGSFNEERRRWHWNFPIQVLFNVPTNTTTLENILANLVDVTPTPTNKRKLMAATAAVFLGQSLAQQRDEREDKKLNTLPYFGRILNDLLQVCSEEARTTFNRFANLFWNQFKDDKSLTRFLQLFRDTFRPDVHNYVNKLTSLRKENTAMNKLALYVLYRSLRFSFRKVMTVENNRLVFDAKEAKAEVKKYFDTYSTLLALAEVVTTPMDNIRGLSQLQGGQSGEEEERPPKRARTEAAAAPAAYGAYGIPSDSAKWRVVGAGSTFYDAASLVSGTSVDDLGAEMAKTWGKQKVETRYQLFGESSTETQQMLLLYGDRPPTWTTGDPQDVHMQVLAKALRVRIAIFSTTQAPTGDFTVANVQPQQVRVSGTEGRWLYLVQHDKQFWGLSPQGDEWSKQPVAPAPVASPQPVAPAPVASPQPGVGDEQVFEFHYAQGDGGCFYYAVEIALQRSREAYKRYGGWDKGDGPAQKQLLREYGKLLELKFRSLSPEKQQKIRYLIELQSEDDGESGRDARNLLNNLSDPDAWVRGYASIHQLSLLSLALKVPFAVYIVDNLGWEEDESWKELQERWKKEQTFTPTDLSRERGTSFYQVYNAEFGEPKIYLLFSGGNHYDALIPRGAPQDHIDFLRTLRQRRTAELDELGPPAQAPPPSPAPAPTREQIQKVQQALADRLLTLLQESAFTKTPQEAADSLRNTLHSALVPEQSSEESPSKRRKIEEKSEVFQIQPEAATAEFALNITAAAAPPPRPSYMSVYKEDVRQANRAWDSTNQEEEVCGTLWYPVDAERLRYKDLQCLNPLKPDKDKWLTGRIINAYLLLIKAAAPQNCVMFNTDVFGVQKLGRVRKEVLLNYTVDKQAIEADTSIIIIPINVEGSRTTQEAYEEARRTGKNPTVGEHWYFMYVQVSTNRLLICDSMKRSDTTSEYTADLTVVKSILAMILGDREVEPSVETTFPQQQNGYDCGVFMSMGIECVTQSRPFDFRRSSNDLRTLMAAQIYRGNLERRNCDEKVQLARRGEEAVVSLMTSPAPAEAQGLPAEAAPGAPGEGAPPAAAQGPPPAAALPGAPGAAEAQGEAALGAAPPDAALGAAPPDAALGAQGEGAPGAAGEGAPLFLWEPELELDVDWTAFLGQLDVSDQEQATVAPRPLPVLAPVPSYMMVDTWRTTLPQVKNAVQNTTRKNEHVTWVDKTFGHKIKLTLEMLDQVFTPEKSVPLDAIRLYMYLLQQRSHWKLDDDIRARTSVILNTFNIDYRDIDGVQVPLRNYWIQNLGKDTADMQDIPADTTVFVALQSYPTTFEGISYSHPYTVVFDRFLTKAVYVLDATPQQLEFYIPFINALATRYQLQEWQDESVTVYPVPLTTDTKDPVKPFDLAVYMCMAVERFTRTRLQQNITVLNLDKAGTQRTLSIIAMRRIMAAQLYVGELDSWERRKERTKKMVEKQDAAKLWLAVQKFKQQTKDATLNIRIIKTHDDINEVHEQITRLQTEFVEPEDRCIRLRCAALEYARREYCKYDAKMDEAQKAIYIASSKRDLAANVKPKPICQPSRVDYFDDKKEEWETQDRVAAAAAASAAEAKAAEAAAEEGAEEEGEAEEGAEEEKEEAEEGGTNVYALMDEMGSPYIPSLSGGLTTEKQEIVERQKRVKAYYTILRDGIEKHVNTYNEVLREQDCVVDTKKEAAKRKSSKKRGAEGEAKNEPMESVEKSRTVYKQEIPKTYTDWVEPLAECAKYAQEQQGKGKVPTQQQLKELNNKLNRLVKSNEINKSTLKTREQIQEIYVNALETKRAQMDAVKFVDSVRAVIQHLKQPVTDRLTAQVLFRFSPVSVEVANATKFRVDSTVKLGNEQRRVASVNGNTLSFKTPLRDNHPADETIYLVQKQTLTIVDVLPGFTKLLDELNREQRSALLAQWTLLQSQLSSSQQLSTSEQLVLENLYKINQVTLETLQERMIPI